MRTWVNWQQRPIPGFPWRLLFPIGALFPVGQPVPVCRLTWSLPMPPRLPQATSALGHVRVCVTKRVATLTTSPPRGSSSVHGGFRQMLVASALALGRGRQHPLHPFAKQPGYHFSLCPQFSSCLALQSVSLLPAELEAGMVVMPSRKSGCQKKSPGGLGLMFCGKARCMDGVRPPLPSPGARPEQLLGDTAVRMGVDAGRGAGRGWKPPCPRQLFRQPLCSVLHQSAPRRASWRWGI